MIPFRLKQALKQWRARRWLGPEIEAIGPVRVATENLRAEVHMMTGRNHLVRAAAALYTLFGHAGFADRVGLRFHLDGTVGRRGRQWLERHFEGAEFTDFPSRDPRVEAVLEGRPRCRRFYEERVSCMTRLIQVPALARSDRGIQLDSDVVFYRRPDAIVDWVDDPTAPPRYQVDHRGEADPGAGVRKLFDEVAARIRRRGLDEVRIKDYYFCPGLILFSARRFSFDVVEAYLEWHATAKPPTPPEWFWFDRWTVEMTGYLLNFAAWPDARPLDETYVVGQGPSPVSNHFFLGSYYRKANLARIRQGLRDVPREARA